MLDLLPSTQSADFYYSLPLHCASSMEAVVSCIVAYAASAEGAGVLLVLGLGAAELVISGSSDLFAQMKRSEVVAADWEASKACAFMEAWPECAQNQFQERAAMVELFFDKDADSVL